MKFSYILIFVFLFFTRILAQENIRNVDNIEENNVEHQEINCTTGSVDIVFVNDQSGSVG